MAVWLKLSEVSVCGVMSKLQPTSSKQTKCSRATSKKCRFWKLPLGMWFVRLRDEVKVGSGVREAVGYQCRGWGSEAGHGGSGVRWAAYGHTMAVWLRLIPLRKTSRLSKCWKREVRQWLGSERKAISLPTLEPHIWSVIADLRLLCRSFCLEVYLAYMSGGLGKSLNWANLYIKYSSSSETCRFFWLETQTLTLS